MAAKHINLECKVALLRYLIDTKSWLHDANADHFWHFVGTTFNSKAAPPGAPQLSGKEIESWWLDEKDAYEKEQLDNQSSYRPGHEPDSEYDQLAMKWTGIWDDMMQEHWKMKVSKQGPDNPNFDIVPPIWREVVKESLAKEKKSPEKKRLSAAQTSSLSVPKTANTTAPQQQPPANNVGQRPAMTPSQIAEASTLNFNSPYDTEEKLKRIVDSAIKRARDLSKHSLAVAILQTYEDSRTDKKLRFLLQAILSNSANPEEQSHFQEYVRAAKRKVKLDEQNQAKQKPANSTPQVQIRKPQEAAKTSVVPVTVDAPKVRSKQKAPPKKAVFPNLQKSTSPKVADDVDKRSATHGRVDSAHGSEQRSDQEAENNKKSTVSTKDSTAAVNKRKSVTQVSPDAERAAKRTKRDESGSTYPAASHKRTEEMTRQSDNPSRASSSLSSRGDTDIEAAKEAYTGEVVRRKSGQPSKQTAETNRRPAPPAVNEGAHLEGIHEWASMPSSEVRETHNTEAQATAGAESITSGRPTDATTRVRDTSPQATPAAAKAVARRPSHDEDSDEVVDGSQAYRLMHAAMAEALDPKIDQLEKKVDALAARFTAQQPTTAPQHQTTSASGQHAVSSSAASSRAAELSAASSNELLGIATALQTGELNAQSPELARLIAKLASTAAEASLHAAEAAKRSAEMARDVSEVLMQIGEKASAAGQRGQ